MAVTHTFTVHGKACEKKDDVNTTDGLHCTLPSTVLQLVTDLKYLPGDLMKKNVVCGEVYWDPQNEQVFVIRTKTLQAL